MLIEFLHFGTMGVKRKLETYGTFLPCYLLFIAFRNLKPILRVLKDRLPLWISSCLDLFLPRYFASLDLLPPGSFASLNLLPPWIFCLPGSFASLDLLSSWIFCLLGLFASGFFFTLRITLAMTLNLVHFIALLHPKNLYLPMEYFTFGRTDGNVSPIFIVMTYFIWTLLPPWIFCLSQKAS